VKALEDLLPTGLETLVIEAPPDRYDVVSLSHREGHVHFKAHLPGATWILVDFPTRLRHRIEEFIRPSLPMGIENPAGHP